MVSAHADVVGSLLRPPELLQARDEMAAGRISPVEFKAIEDPAVDQAIALQEEAGLEVVTDGEQRRLSLQSQLPEAAEGFGKWDIDAFLWGDWKGDDGIGDWSQERPAKLGVNNKLRRKRHLSSEEFTYLRTKTQRVPKITLPSPSLWVNFWSAEQSATAYPALGYLADVVDILHEEVEELVRLGATYIQLDASQYVDLERLAFNPQCGFSTSVIGNAISLEDEKYKLRTIVETAQQFWG